MATPPLGGGSATNQESDPGISLAQELENRYFSDLSEERKEILRQLIREQHADATRALLTEPANKDSNTNVTSQRPTPIEISNNQSNSNARDKTLPNTELNNHSSSLPPQGERQPTTPQGQPPARTNSTTQSSSSLPQREHQPTPQGQTSVQTSPIQAAATSSQRPSPIILSTNIPAEMLKDIIRRTDIISKAKPANAEISHIKGPIRGSNNLVIYPAGYQDWHRLLAKENWNQLEFKFTPRIQDNFTVGRTVVIRGVDLSIPTRAVQERLIELGFSPSDVSRIEVGKEDNRRQTLSVAVTLNSQKDYERFLDLKEIVIKWKVMKLEAFKKITPIQCYSCQAFGHTQKDCNNKPRCVKCGGEHRKDECPTPLNLRCANCQEIHSASDRGCIARIREIRRLRNQKLGNSEGLEQSTAPRRETTANSWATMVEKAAPKPSPAVPPWSRSVSNETPIRQTIEKNKNEIIPAIAGLLKSVVSVIKSSQETGTFDANGAMKLIEEWENEFLSLNSPTDEDFPSLATGHDQRRRRNNLAPFNKSKAKHLDRLTQVTRSELDLSAARDHMPDMTMERSNLLLDEACQTPVRRLQSPSEGSSPTETFENCMESLPRPSTAPTFNLNIRPLDAGTPLANKPLRALDPENRSSPKRKASDSETEEPATKQALITVAPEAIEPTNDCDKIIEDSDEENNEMVIIGHGPEGAITMAIPSPRQGSLQVKLSDKKSQGSISKLPRRAPSTTRGAKATANKSDIASPADKGAGSKPRAKTNKK